MSQDTLFNEITDHVKKLPIVHEMYDMLNSSKLLPLFTEHGQAFTEAPAAHKHHHNFTHGLLIHTAEVWQAAKRFIDHAPHSKAYDLNLAEDICHVENGSINWHEFWFNIDELFNVVMLHDFAKIKQYVQTGNYTWKFQKMICNQETWTLRELAKNGIQLTDNELVGLQHAEGGYTEFDVEWRPLSVIMHASDLWSSQAMYAVWDPAKEADIKCKDCNAPMAIRQGPRGPFYGCTEYPNCKGITNINETPPVEKTFLNFLEKNYPLPEKCQ